MVAAAFYARDHNITEMTLQNSTNARREAWQSEHK